MEIVTASFDTVGKTPVKKHPKPKKKKTHQYCVLCRKNYPTDNTHEHLHSILHHKELDIVLGRDSFHGCHACKRSFIHLSQYTQHVNTTSHKANFVALLKSSVKPLQLIKILSPEQLQKVLQRNKALKKEEKKTKGKEKKKMKLEAKKQTTEKQAKPLAKKPALTKTSASGLSATATETSGTETSASGLRATATETSGSGVTLIQNEENGLADGQQNYHSQYGCKTDIDFTSDDCLGATLYDEETSEREHHLGIKPTSPIGSNVGADQSSSTSRMRMNPGKSKHGAVATSEAYFEDESQLKARIQKEFTWKLLHRDGGMPRFGADLRTLNADQEAGRGDQMETVDLTLLEGTHWEAATVTVKGEMMSPEVMWDGGIHAEKRKQQREPVMDDDVSSMEPSRKKRKRKLNKDNTKVDQLLAVSLREEELCRSLEDLEHSLVQARNVVQAAYAEVQRIMVLKQKVTSEIKGLRGKRIEILQGLQDVMSSTAEKESRALVESSVSVSNSHSPLPSSSLHVSSPLLPPSASTPPSPVGRVYPAAITQPSAMLKLKQEVHFNPAAEGQAALLANVVPCANAATPTVHNQSLPILPPVLLPTLPVPQSKSGPALLGVPAPLNPSVECPANISPPGELSIQQLEQEGGVRGTSAGGGSRQTGDVPVVAAATGEGYESEGSIVMMEKRHEVISIDESDSDEVPNAPVHSERQEKVVTVEPSSASRLAAKDKAKTRSDTLVPSPKSVPDVTPAVVPVDATEIPNAPVHSEHQEKVVKVEPSSASQDEKAADATESETLAVGTFQNHTGPVHGLQVHSGLLYTCSGDNTARAYCLASKECQAVFEGHTNNINCLLVASFSPNTLARLYTGSSDKTVRCYSTKSKKCLQQISLPDRVLCLHIAWSILYVGLSNGSVVSFELKTLKQLEVFECHGPRGVCCMGTSQEGARRLLLVGSYDSTISVRDAKSGLLLRTLEGHTKTVLCMKVVNDLVFSGSSDTAVHAHNIHTGELVRIYKGHDHAVTSIIILGKVMVTACLDKLVRVYELQSHDRLQVYGGHTDMVMCMAIHKSVIYTGCYDGSIQAVKLNLMKNYRCWWHGCSLIFGLTEHLTQHLLRDHTNCNLSTSKCRWRNCETFFPTPDAVKQELPVHMQSHVEIDSRLSQ